MLHQELEFHIRRAELERLRRQAELDRIAQAARQKPDASSRWEGAGLVGTLIGGALFLFVWLLNNPNLANHVL